MVIVTSNIIDTQMWLEKIKVAITKAKKNMAHATAKHGKKLLRTIAPDGVRSMNKSLRGSGKIQSFGDQASLYIRKDNEKIALVNEFGLKAPKFLNFEAFPELRDWAEKKYPRYNKDLKGLTIGGKGTYLGTKNVFWYPLFQQLGRDTPHIMVREIEKELNKIK